jgi:hypothetical protein
MGYHHIGFGRLSRALLSCFEIGSFLNSRRITSGMVRVNGRFLRAQSFQIALRVHLAPAPNSGNRFSNGRDDNIRSIQMNIVAAVGDQDLLAVSRKKPHARLQYSMVFLKLGSLLVRKTGHWRGQGSG